MPPFAVARAGDREAKLHLSSNAELFSPDDLYDCAGADNEPEKERSRKGRGIVGSEDDVHAEQGKRKVEDVGRSSYEMVKVEDAVRESWVNYVHR